MINHHIKACRALVAKQHGSWCRLVGKQFTVPQKFSPSDNCGIAKAGKNFIMQFGGLRQMLNQPTDDCTLFEGKSRIHIFRGIIRCPPARSGIMGGYKGQPVDAAQRGQLSAQRRLVKKIALP